MKYIKRFLAVFFCFMTIGVAAPIEKMDIMAGSNSNIGVGYPDFTTMAILLVLMAMLPFLVMLLTSFLKMVITMSLLRNAIGVQQTPPNQVVNGIALILTVYVMYPTGVQMGNAAKEVYQEYVVEGNRDIKSAEVVIAMASAAKEPLKQFLIRNTQSSHIKSFYKIAQKTFPENVKQDIEATDFLVIVPAFISSQLRTAFEIGVLIYLPFFVIDLVTSNILLAMQMMMLSPLSISLPLKILLIVMLDGWTILIQGLVMSFQ